jgi:hypothetical protein
LKKSWLCSRSSNTLYARPQPPQVQRLRGLPSRAAATASGLRANNASATEAKSASPPNTFHSGVLAMRASKGFFPQHVALQPEGHCSPRSLYLLQKSHQRPRPRSHAIHSTDRPERTPGWQQLSSCVQRLGPLSLGPYRVGFDFRSISKAGLKPRPRPGLDCGVSSTKDVLYRVCATKHC